MMKRASGVAAKVVAPRGFMFTVMVAVLLAAPTMIWMWWWAVPLIWWLSVNGALLAIFTIVCCVKCNERTFDWRDADRTPVVWSIWAAWMNDGSPSFFRLILWLLLVPAEIVATFVARPLTLVMRALLRPLPGSGWGTGNSR